MTYSIIPLVNKEIDGCIKALDEYKADCLTTASSINMLKNNLSAIDQKISRLSLLLGKLIEEYHLDAGRYILELFGNTKALIQNLANMLKLDDVDVEVFNKTIDECVYIWQEELLIAGWHDEFIEICKTIASLDTPRTIPENWQDHEWFFSVLNSSQHSLVQCLGNKHRMDRVFNLLSAAERIEQSAIADVMPYLHSDPLLFMREDSRKAAIYALTRELIVKQEGRIPKHQHEHIDRRPRLFSSEREAQILRQISTQLFYGFNNALKVNPTLLSIEKKNRPKLVEVEIMHLTYKGRSKIFVAVNEHAVTQYLKVLFEKENDHFVRILTTNHAKRITRDSEGKIRSARYAKKLERRVFSNAGISIPESTSVSDSSRAHQLAIALREAELSVFDYNMHNRTEFERNVRRILSSPLNEIYFIEVKNCPFKERHAEEFLVDIVESAKSVIAEVEVSIAGKKRPCMSCTGRMSGEIYGRPRVDQYNKNPGSAWVTVQSMQPKEVAARTASVMLTQPAHRTVNRSGKVSKDHGTDSASP
jgi:hypothetical protein